MMLMLNIEPFQIDIGIAVESVDNKFTHSFVLKFGLILFLRVFESKTSSTAAMKCFNLP